jgi:GntR family transcriptional repressor for pyruvate dehydrogenase complex
VHEDPLLAALRRVSGTESSASASVVQLLLRLLLGEQMRPGDRLPGERSLADALGVGRSAVREAIAALELLGIVQTRVGSGTYLRSASSELLPQTLSWSMLVDQERTEDLTVVRGALERTAAEIAAARATPDDVERLRALVHDQRAAARTGEYVDLDVAFHQHIAAISGNRILIEMLATSRSLLRVGFENAVDDARDIDAAIEEHHAVAEAIAAGDPAAAQAAMARHMVTASARIVRTAERR